MINYLPWKKINEILYEKRCIDNSHTSSIKLRYHCNGYGWVPEFYNKLMGDLYIQYNPDYYISIIDIHYVTQYIDNFINRYNNLLVFM